MPPKKKEKVHQLTNHVHSEEDVIASCLPLCAVQYGYNRAVNGKRYSHEHQSNVINDIKYDYLHVGVSIRRAVSGINFNSVLEKAK